MLYIGTLILNTFLHHLSVCSSWNSGPNQPIERFHVVELGCGDGTNLITLAFRYQQATFIGIDVCETAINHALNIVDKLGLDNIHFECKDVRNLDSSEVNRSDFVLVHGLYSWVPENTRSAILSFCAENLKPNGLAYISYNAQPGWSTRALVRETLLRSRQVQEAAVEDKGYVAIQVAQQLLEDLPSRDYASAVLLVDELERVVHGAPWYVFHEYLAEFNEGFWLRDFVEKARSFGLEYVADAQFCRPEGQVPQSLRDSLAERELDQVEQEEIADLLCNRFFHASILCRADAPRSDLTHREIVDKVHIATSIEALSEPFQLDEGVVENFEGRGGAEVTIDTALTKAVILLLANIWPLGMRFEEVYEKAVAFLTQHGFEADTEKKEVLADELIRLFECGQVDFRLQENQNVVETLQDYPHAHALARYEAEHREALTTPYHIPVLFEPEEMALIRAADGSKTLDELRAKFGKELTDRTLLVAGRCGLLEASA